jgi:hypothetical protein
MGQKRPLRSVRALCEHILSQKPASQFHPKAARSYGLRLHDFKRAILLLLLDTSGLEERRLPLASTRASSLH